MKKMMQCQVLKEEFDKNKKSILIVVVTVLSVVVVFLVANVFFGQKNKSTPVINNVIKESSSDEVDKDIQKIDNKNPREKRREVSMNSKDHFLENNNSVNRGNRLR